MKVGILTFYRAPNYGTALQAFATQKAISKLGVEAEIIDYRPQYIERTLQKRKIKNAKSFKEVLSIVINAVIYPNMIKRKAESFGCFSGLMNISDNVCFTTKDVEKVSQSYDVILSGSDQLFNRNITSSDMTFFLPFEHKRKVSFASSFGESWLSVERIGEIAPFLAEFDFISAREKTAENIFSEIRKVNTEVKSATIVLDPTFLLTKDEWNEYADCTMKLPKDGFILTYYLRENSILRSITARLQQKTGLKVVNIKPSKSQMIFHSGKNFIYAGPSQLLSCYKKASYVVTNSFHGTALAINYGVPFFSSVLISSKSGDVNSRISDVCELFGLSNRFIDSEQKLKTTDLTKPFEKETEKILQNLREHSFSYLKEALNIK